MCRTKRNADISNAQERGDISHPEMIILQKISGYIGDDVSTTIEWDDLAEATGIDDYAEIEDYLSLMYECDIITVLDFENDIIGDD